MQPYVFPYIGYFHLIEATNKIIFYDDVNFIKRGWINRNRILINGQDYLFTIPVEKASQNKLINEIIPLIDQKFIDTFLAQLSGSYKKAPYFNQVIELVANVLTKKYENVSDLAIQSIVDIYSYLEKDFHFGISSKISPETQGIDKAERLIRITKDLGFKHYTNAIGGQVIYEKSHFAKAGVELNFVKSKLSDYKQFKNEFVPWLSIIDVLMFNDIETIKEVHLQSFEII